MSDQNLTKREQLAELMSAALADENTAVKEFASFVESSEGKAFVAKIQEFHNRTVPGSNFDQIFGSILQIMDGSGKAAKSIANPEPAGVDPGNQEGQG